MNTIPSTEVIELVYMVPYLGEQPQQGRDRILRYTKLNGQVDTHKRSPDKEKYDHCYDSLEPGKNYVVITRSMRQTRGGRNRWVYIDYYELAGAEMAQMLVDRIRSLDMFNDRAAPGYQTTQPILNRAATEVVKVWKAMEATQKLRSIIKDTLVW
jgi:hypothetical protein